LAVSSAWLYRQVSRRRNPHPKRLLERQDLEANYAGIQVSRRRNPHPKRLLEHRFLREIHTVKGCSTPRARHVHLVRILYFYKNKPSHQVSTSLAAASEHRLPPQRHTKCRLRLQTRTSWSAATTFAPSPRPVEHGPWTWVRRQWPRSTPW
jgi:hypothetical protein